MALPFWLSDAVLLGTQAVTVALPRRDAFAPLRRLKARAWALVPLVSIVATVFAIRDEPDVAKALSWLALVAVPLLAAVALGHAMRGGRWWLAPLAGVLLALFWNDQFGLPGEAAALILVSLSC